MLIRRVGKKSTIRMLKMLLPSFTVTWAIVKKFLTDYNEMEDTRC